MTSSMVYNANAIYEVDRLTSYNTSFERYFSAEQKSQLSKVSKIAPSFPETHNPHGRTWLAVFRLQSPFVVVEVHVICC